MDRQDFEILEDLLEVIEETQQCSGSNPDSNHRSSSRKLRKDVAEFAELCRHGELKGRARKRRSGELFRRIVSLHPSAWQK